MSSRYVHIGDVPNPAPVPQPIPIPSPIPYVPIPAPVPTPTPQPAPVIAPGTLLSRLSSFVKTHGSTLLISGLLGYIAWDHFQSPSPPPNPPVPTPVVLDPVATGKKFIPELSRSLADAIHAHRQVVSSTPLPVDLTAADKTLKDTFNKGGNQAFYSRCGPLFESVVADGSNITTEAQRASYLSVCDGLEKGLRSDVR